MVSITQTIKNIIIQFDINYKCFEEDYEKKLDGLEINDLRKELKIPETDHLKKNGTFKRNIYYLVDCCLKCSRIRIQKLQWTTTIDGEEKKIYISVFPSFVIKYNKVSADTIEYISNTCRKGEDIFTVIDDPECVLLSEDLLHNACKKVNETCKKENYASILNTRYTEIYELTITLPELIAEINELRYPEIVELYHTGQVFTANSERILSTLNIFFKFLR